MKGIGFSGTLTLVLVVAKLLGYFPYSWWWVFSPVILAVILWIALVAVMVVLSVWLDS